MTAPFQLTGCRLSGSRLLSGPPNTYDELYALAGQVPAFDLRFDRGSIVDVINGIWPTYTRPSSTKLAWNGSQLASFAADVPAFQVDPLTGRLGYLHEPAATNLALRSEEFDNAQWAKARCSVTPNATSSPTGSTTADKLVEDTTPTNNHQLVVTPVLTSSVYTVSVFAKAAERTQLAIRLDVPGSETVVFNLTTGTIASATAGVAGSITPFGNGWFRVAATLTTAAVVTNYIFQLTVGGSVTYTGDGTSGLFIWGAQVETGPVATSPIITSGSAVTRAADTMTVSGVPFSSRFPAGNFTTFCSYVPILGGAQQFVLGIDNSATAVGANELRAFNGGNDSRQVAGSSGAVDQFTYFSSGSITPGQRETLVTAYGVNNTAIAGRGFTRPATDTSCALPVGLDRLAIGARANLTFRANMLFERFAVFPGRISDGQIDAMALL